MSSTTSTSSTTTATDRARQTKGRLGRSALIIGVLAVLQLVVAPVLLTWVWPGEGTAIAILTILSYALPLVGIVVGHVVRRREGPTVLSTTGLVLSYLGLAGAIVPLLIDLVALLVSS